MPWAARGVPPGGQLGGGLGDPVGDQSVVQVSQHQPDAPGGQGLWVQGGKTGVDPRGMGENRNEGRPPVGVLGWSGTA